MVNEIKSYGYGINISKIQILGVCAIAGAIVSISSSILEIVKFQEKCFTNRKICELLKREKYLYLAHADTYKNLKDNEERYEQLVQHVEMIFIENKIDSEK